MCIRDRGLGTKSPDQATRARSAREPRETSRDLARCFSVEASRASERVRGLGTKSPDQATSAQSAREPRETSRDLASCFSVEASRASERVRGLGTKSPDQTASARSAREPHERSETWPSAFQWSQVERVSESGVRGQSPRGQERARGQRASLMNGVRLGPAHFIGAESNE